MAAMAASHSAAVRTYQSLIHCLLSLRLQETQILTKRVLKAIHIL